MAQKKIRYYIKKYLPQIIIGVIIGVILLVIGYIANPPAIIQTNEDRIDKRPHIEIIDQPELLGITPVAFKFYPVILNKNQYPDTAISYFFHYKNRIGNNFKDKDYMMRKENRFKTKEAYDSALSAYKKEFNHPSNRAMVYHLKVKYKNTGLRKAYFFYTFVYDSTSSAGDMILLNKFLQSDMTGYISCKDIGIEDSFFQKELKAGDTITQIISMPCFRLYKNDEFVNHILIFYTDDLENFYLSYSWLYGKMYKKSPYGMPEYVDANDSIVRIINYYNPKYKDYQPALQIKKLETNDKLIMTKEDEKTIKTKILSCEFERYIKRDVDFK
ncbi:MAG: hypothetical protein IAE93_05860 [Ignavibacteria bacterium]|nr:hypothetical protein [Ignavibacteria bacterium]